MIIIRLTVTVGNVKTANVEDEQSLYSFVQHILSQQDDNKHATQTSRVLVLKACLLIKEAAEITNDQPGQIIQNM